MSDLFKFSSSKASSSFVRPDQYGLNQKRNRALNDDLSGQFEKNVLENKSSQKADFLEALRSVDNEPSFSPKLSPDISIQLQEISQNAISNDNAGGQASPGKDYMRRAYLVAEELQESVSNDSFAIDRIDVDI